MIGMISLLLVALGVFAPPSVYAQSSATSFTLATAVEEQPLCLTYNPVTIILPENELNGVSCHREPYDILKDFGFERAKYEVLKDITNNGMRTLSVTPVERARKLVWQKIKYNTEITYVKNITHRKKAVDVKGKDGLRGIITEEITFPDGKKKSVVVEKWVEREPITERARVGTKYNLQKIVVNGKTIYYWKTLTVRATSYDSTCYGCNKTTATGAYLTKGIVAVDPKVIPLHTNMYIPGYGFGKAEDTGGQVKGNRIDLAYDDIRYGDWSRRWVTIYIID